MQAELKFFAGAAGVPGLASQIVDGLDPVRLILAAVHLTPECHALLDIPLVKDFADRSTGHGDHRVAGAVGVEQIDRAGCAGARVRSPEGTRHRENRIEPVSTITGRVPGHRPALTEP